MANVDFPDFTENTAPIANSYVVGYQVDAAGGERRWPASSLPISNAVQTALDAKVSGPASATANAVALFDGTTGKLIQNSNVTYDGTTLTANVSGTATALATVRTIGGSNFDGTANVTSFPAPGAIGGTTPSTGAFTEVKATTTSIAPGLIIERTGAGAAIAQFAMRGTRLSLTQTAGSLTLGDSVTTLTAKNARLGAEHYTDGEEPLGVFYGASSASSNLLAIGGGSALLNAATAIEFYTAATTTTTTGTRRGGFSSSGILDVTASTASTSTTTGALILSGTDAGIGITGALNSARAGIGTSSSATTCLILAAGTTGVSSLRLPHGVAPTSPVNGDFWTTTAGAYARINGATVLLGSGGGGDVATDAIWTAKGQIAAATGSAAAVAVDVGTDGQTLVANSAATAGVSWSNAGSGTVTNVALTVPTGLTVSGSPITSAGTLALGLDTGYVIPTQNALDAKVDDSVNVIAGTGLDGGGALTGNVAISVSSATAASLDLADSAVQPGDLGTMATENASDYTNTAGFANVAFSGEYTDIANVPTIPNAIFSTIVVSGQDNVVADTATDVLTLVAGANVTITTNAATDTVTLAVADSIPYVAPGASGNVLTSNGSAWTSAPLSFAGITAGVLAANMTLGEDVGQIVLDPALSADGKYSGIVEAGTAGATLAFGDLCYFAVADSRWELADADADATAGAVMLGLCVLAAASDGDPTLILRLGKIRADAAFPTLTIGAPAYVSTTAGDIQVAQPSGTDDVIRIVGHAITADVLFFNPSNDFLTHT